MKDHHKIRAWDKESRSFFFFDLLTCFWSNGEESQDWTYDEWEPELRTGITNVEGQDFYHNDIGEFDNGDRFQIKKEEWLEFYVEWIGEPECEDQARDFYRIAKAKKIGNIHENPELLK